MKYKKCAILVAFFTKDPKYKSSEITNSVRVRTMSPQGWK